MSEEHIEDRIVSPDTVPASQPTNLTASVPNVRAIHNAVARCGRGGKYFPAELLSLLTIMGRVLPIGPTEWEMGLKEYSLKLFDHDVNSVQHNFTAMHRRKI